MPRLLLAAVMLAAGFAAGLGALALATDENGTVYHACVNNGSGTIKMIDETGTCSNNEQRVVWNQKGPKGDPGEKGAKGDTGPEGPRGEPADVTALENRVQALETQVATLQSQVGRIFPTLSIEDVQRPEDASEDEIVFTVTLSEPSQFTVFVDYSTTDGTARSNRDYVSTSGTLSFPPDETTQTITVPVIPRGQTLTFSVNLSNPVYADIEKGQGVGTILHTSPLPMLSIEDVKFDDEMTIGVWTELEFTVTLSESSPFTVSVDYATLGGNDYHDFFGFPFDATSGTLVFEQGATEQTFTVNVRPQGYHVTFYVELFNAVFADIAKDRGVGTIYHDDTPWITILADADCRPGALCEFPLLLSGPSNESVTVDYETMDDGCSKAGEHYQAASGTLTFASGETLKSIAIDTLHSEPVGCSFIFKISNPHNAIFLELQELDKWSYVQGWGHLWGWP
jgi:hypothetical protein